MGKKHQQDSTKPNAKKTDNRLKNKVEKNINSMDLLGFLDKFFLSRRTFFLWLSFAFTVLFALFIFDLKVSKGGDDSAYIIRASDLINDFRYPGFQGPLYPMILSIFIALFGINLSILKIVSLVFISLHFWFFYKVFSGKINESIAAFSALIISINSYLLYYGSQTYSEALFMFEQMLLFWIFFKYFVNTESETINIRNDYKRFTFLGLIVFLMVITRSIGITSILAIFSYFILNKQWKSIGWFSVFFGFIFALWEGLKRIIWSSAEMQFSSQGSILLNKEPYDSSAGKEDILGFITRFFENSHLYFSKHFYKFLGLRPEITEPIIALTVLTFILLALALFFAFRKNKFILFSGLYVIISLFVTFIVLQKKWESSRMIIPFFPIMLLFIFSGIYYLLKFKVLKILQFLFPIIFIFLFFISLKVSLETVKEQQKLLRANLRGDRLAGFTPDWVNFLKMSEWAAQNVPADAKIASRKPDISFIYTNRRFWGMFNVPSENADTLLNILKKNNVRYVIMASLRKFEAQKTEYTINTEMRFLYYIQQKYPEAVKPVFQIGDDEKATLFEITY